MLIAAALAALFVSFNLHFQAGLREYKSYWQDVATEMPSTTKTQTYAWMDATPKMREWVGDRVFNRIATRSYSLTNKTFEDSIVVPKESIEDDTIGLFMPIVKELGKQTAKLPDDLVTAVILAAGTTNTWDNQYFFDTDHPIDFDDSASATQANYYVSSALDSTTFNTVRTGMKLQKDKSGHFIGVRPNILMVPPQLESTARLICEAEYIPNADGTATQSNPDKGKCTVLVVDELGDYPSTWYMLDTTGPIRPFIFQSRTQPELSQQTDPASDTVFNRREFRYGTDRRCAAGQGLYWYAAKAIAAAS